MLMPKGINIHHVTMTGELVDIFINREQGVKEIINAFETILPNDDASSYFSSKGLLNKVDAFEKTGDIASVNWVASGRCVSQFCEEAIFVDIGSTTTDVLSISNGALSLKGLTDFERLRTGELVYTGVVRSCVNTLCRSIFYKDKTTPLIAENFAVTADVYRILNCLPAHADYGNTMDGKAKDKESSMRRLARMIGEDYRDNDSEEWHSVAEYLALKQKELIKESIQKKLKEFVDKPIIIGAGVGRFLVEQLADEMVLPYSEFTKKILPDEISYEPHSSDCTPAIALLFE